MIQKIIATVSIALVVGIGGISCTEDISDCPNKLCVMSGGWKLSEVRLDGELYTEDFSKFQLVLNNPSPTTEINSDFVRVNISGTQDAGTWTVENTNPNQQGQFQGSILRLRPSDNTTLTEDWEIEEFTPREMILVMHRDISLKQGPATIRFVLVPF